MYYNYHGYGKLIYPDGNYIVGYYNQGKMEGTGITYFNNGSKFEAIFLDGEVTGLGKYFYADGDMFIGEYEKIGGASKRNGTGTFYYRDGKQFTASWAQGEVLGIAVLLSERGEIISQDWNQSKHKKYINELSGNSLLDDNKIQDDQEKILIYSKKDRESLKIRKKREIFN